MGRGAKKGRLPKICHRYPTTMKLRTVMPYLKKIQKKYESPDTHPELWRHRHFFIGNQQTLLYQEIQIQIAFWYIILILLTFLEFLKIFLINMAISLIMSAKMAPPGLLKTTVFWNKDYDIITTAHDFTNKILWRDSNYIVDVLIWPKFGNSSDSKL